MYGQLTVLRLENLAVVERAELELAPGLTVITGDTGAGKSIWVDALSLVLGGKAGAEVIRAGASEAVVEALFVWPHGTEVRERLDAAGVALVDDELVVRRVVPRSGRGRVTLNGQLTSLGNLSQLLRGVAEISAQHEHVALLDPERHARLVDAFAGAQAQALEVREAHHAVARGRAALSELELGAADAARREATLREQLAELDALAPTPGELERLDAERKRLLHAAKLVDGAQRAEDALYSAEGAVVDVLGRVEAELAQLGRIDPAVDALERRLGEALSIVEEVAHQLGRYARGVDLDAGRLDTVEARYEQLRRVARRHGGSLEGAIAAQSELRSTLDELEGLDARRARARSELDAAETRLARAAGELTRTRREACARLEAAVEKELRTLGMAHARIEVLLEPLERPDARGAERVELGWAPNPGEPARSLARIASGGELSRVLLSLHQVLASQDVVGTYVFDEVDAGMGGAAADTVGRKLRDIAGARQVVCVTHAAQVAAHADQHVVIRKGVVGGRTQSVPMVLDEAQRVAELARMLGGAEVSRRTLDLAEELRAIARAGRERRLGPRRTAPAARARAKVAS